MKERRVEKDININQLRGPSTGSKAPCCGGELSGLCLLIIHFKF